MEYVFNKSKFYEFKGDSINIVSNIESNEEFGLEEVFSEFDSNSTPTLKSLKKCLALNNVQAEDIGVYDENRKRKVLFPQQLEASTNRRMLRRNERKAMKAALVEEQRIGLEILKQEYDEFRINQEIEEMFRLYRSQDNFEENNNNYEIVLDCTQMNADEINEILDQENA